MARVQRGDVSSILLPDEVSETLLRGAAEASLIQTYGRSRPMSAANVKLTEAEVSGANVFWVGEGARKQTDAPTMGQATWTMSEAELAVIVPLDENVQDDAAVDLFELYKPAIETAIAKKLDSAALFGLDKPAAWGALGTDIMPGIVTTGGRFAEDVSPTDDELLDLLSGTGVPTADGALQHLEDNGYEPTGALSYIRFKSRLRNLKDLDGRYIFGDASGPGEYSSVFGVPNRFVKNDIWVASDAHLIMGDWTQAIIGTRQGIRYKIFDQGVITDGAGNVVYSLMESDMIALRVTARYGFKVLADDTADGGTLIGGSEFPFAAVAPNP